MSKQKLTKEQLKVIEQKYATVVHAEPMLRNFDIEVRVTRKGEKSAFPDREVMLVGWKEIAEFLELHEITCIKQYRAQFKRDGITFFKKISRGPGKPVRRFVCCYPSAIVAWSVREGQKKQSELRQSIISILERCV